MANTSPTQITYATLYYGVSAPPSAARYADTPPPQPDEAHKNNPGNIPGSRKATQPIDDEEYYTDNQIVGYPYGPDTV